MSGAHELAELRRRLAQAPASLSVDDREAIIVGLVERFMVGLSEVPSLLTFDEWIAQLQSSWGGEHELVAYERPLRDGARLLRIDDLRLEVPYRDPAHPEGDLHQIDQLMLVDDGTWVLWTVWWKGLRAQAKKTCHGFYPLGSDRLRLLLEANDDMVPLVVGRLAKAAERARLEAMRRAEGFDQLHAECLAFRALLGL